FHHRELRRCSNNGRRKRPHPYATIYPTPVANRCRRTRRHALYIHLDHLRMTGHAQHSAQSSIALERSQPGKVPASQGEIHVSSHLHGNLLTKTFVSSHNLFTCIIQRATIVNYLVNKC